MGCWSKPGLYQCTVAQENRTYPASEHVVAEGIRRVKGGRHDLAVNLDLREVTRH